MSHPYRDDERTIPPPDPRWVAETQLIQARANLLEEIQRGLRIANQLAIADETSESYKRRVEALTALHKQVYK